MPRPTLADRFRRFVRRAWRWLFGRDRRPPVRPAPPKPQRAHIAGWTWAPGGVSRLRTWAGEAWLAYRLLVSPTGIVWPQTETLTKYERVHLMHDSDDEDVSGWSEEDIKATTRSMLDVDQGDPVKIEVVYN